MSPSNPAMKTSESLNVTIAVSDIPKLFKPLQMIMPSIRKTLQSQ